MVRTKKLEKKLLELFKSKNITSGFYGGKSIPNDLLCNVIESYSLYAKAEDVIGLFDLSPKGKIKGKIGLLFTSEKVYLYSSSKKENKKFWYEDIESLTIKYNKSGDQDSLQVIADNKEILIANSRLNFSALKKFLEYAKKEARSSYEYMMNLKIRGSQARTIQQVGTYATAPNRHEKVRLERNMKAFQGHGYAAEHANHAIDKLKGKNSKIVGSDNATYGPDRLVNGVQLQTKYCRNAGKTLEACFEDGQFKYRNADGSPMTIEVPRDQYDEAVKLMKKRIDKGQVKGITDEMEAEDLIRKGNVTYNQAKKIAQAGTIESLLYDATTGIITATTAFGISGTISLALELWNGNDFKSSLKMAAQDAFKSAGASLLTEVVIGQLSKTGLHSELSREISDSKTIMELLEKLDLADINLLSTEIIDTAASTVIFSFIDMKDFLLKRISHQQLIKNIIITSSTLTMSRLASFVAGSLTKNPLAKFITGVASANITNIGAKKILDQYLEDDSVQLIEIIENEFEKLTEKYLLTAKEVEKTADSLVNQLNPKKLKDMYSSKNKHQFARDLLIPIIEAEVSKRTIIHDIPTIHLVNNLMSA